MILTIIAFILILGIFIFVHELGHFISAKKAGVRVEEFGFGFPPRIFGIKKGETIYSLNCIPIGGFVKLYGEDGSKKRTRSKRAFYNKPIWQRTIILASGVIMNLFVAAIVLSIVHGIGVPSIIDQGEEANFHNIQIQIVEIAKNSPAQEAGLNIGDTINALSFGEDKTEVKETKDVQEFTAFHVGEEITLEIRRGSKSFEEKISLRTSFPEGEGPLGVAVAKTGLRSYPWYQAILKGLEATGRLLVTFIGLFYILIKALILKGTLIGEIAGPVGIYGLTSQVVQLGWVYVLQFAAILSINLVIINSIPIPALDGGRLLFLAIEKIKGKPLKFRTEQLANTIGFVILMLLILVVTFRDIIKLF